MNTKTNFRTFPTVLTIAMILMVVISQFGWAVSSASAYVSGTISGVINGPGGSPLTGIPVLVRAVLKSDGTEVATTYTNPADGTYQLTSLALPQELAVVASDEDPDTDGLPGRYFNNVGIWEWAETISLTIGSPTRTGVDITLTLEDCTAEHLTFNTTAERILSDGIIRQAIAYGTNRQVILVNAFGPTGITGEILNTMVYPDAWYAAASGDPLLTTYSYNPTQAGTLLDGAGWNTFNAEGYREKDSQELALDFITTTAAARVNAAAIFQTQMAAIGIRIYVYTYSPAVFFSDDPMISPLADGNFDIAEFAWVLQDYDNFIGVYNTGNEQNFGGYSNSTLDGYFNAARNAKGTGDQTGFLNDALAWQYLFSTELPALPMFTRVPLDLYVNLFGTGSGTVTSTPAGIDCGLDCEEIYALGTVVKLTATASAGSLFTGWSGVCTGLKFCWVTMDTAKVVGATFTLIPAGTKPLTVVKGGTGSGTATSTPAGIDCGADCWEFYTTGTVVKLTATASPGSTFVGWTGACGSMDYCWLTMGAAKYVTANFMLTPPGTYPLIVARKGTGSGTVTSTPAGIACGTDCYEFYTSGTLVKLTAVASPGSIFTGWSGACGGTAYCWVTMSKVRFVTANFTLSLATLSPLEVFRSPADMLATRLPGWMWEVLRKWIPIS